MLILALDPGKFKTYQGDSGESDLTTVSSMPSVASRSKRFPLAARTRTRG